MTTANSSGVVGDALLQAQDTTKGLTKDRVASPTINIPQHGFPASNPKKTPKTPADEAIDFFDNAVIPGETPIQVFELKLDPDGGPSKDKSVRE